MPYGNRKGPEGKGPKTGRGLGLCSGSDTPGYTKDTDRRGAGRISSGFLGKLGRGLGFAGRLGFGRGQGFGRGLGRGLGRTTNINENIEITPKEEQNVLQDDIQTLEEELKLAKDRLKKIKKGE